MTPPLCVECHRNPVKRAYPKDPCKRGPRIVDGVQWRWFCSRRCAGLDRGTLAFTQGQTLQAHRYFQRKAEERVLARLIAACKDVMDADGRVEAKAMVKVLWAEIRRERALQACRRWRRRKAGIAA